MSGYKRSSSTLLRWAIVLIAQLAAVSAEAQWQTQTISLQPGWNAVFLEVQPEPRDPATVFKDLPVESVWLWNRKFSSVQFIQDVSTLVPPQADWLFYAPASSNFALLTNLFSVLGNRAYLVKVSGDAPVDWHVTGTPLVQATDWLTDSYNFVGFHVDQQNPPTFATYFAPSPAQAGGPIYELGPSGQWTVVGNLAAEAIQRGKAYWVFCKGASTYPGPIRATLEHGGAVDFGRVLTESVIRLENHATAAKSITLQLQASAQPPDGQPAFAGVVPLSTWNPSTRVYDPLTGSFALQIPAGGQASVRLAVRRKDMAASSDPSARYQDLLELRDGTGLLLTLPVVARGLTGPEGSATSRHAAVAAGGTGSAQAGLWVGTAKIDHVSFAADPSDKTTPQPTASEMDIRLIVHLDGGGQARLLQQVTLLWKDGTTKPDPTDPTKTVVDQPGRYVLITRDDLLAQFTGASLRGGQPVGRRVSSAAFGFRDPVPMTGSFGSSLTSMPVVLDYDDPVNPFKHKYHPDHDNLDFDFQTQLPEGRESYTVTRTIQLTFTSTDPDGLSVPGFGDTQVGGTYHEDIAGIHRQVLHVSGTFRLQQASRIAVLNDGM